MSIITTSQTRKLIVSRLRASASRGLVRLGPLSFACALGRGGVISRKREGDGATPRGQFQLREVLYNPKRVRRPRSGLPVRMIRPGDGWCDEARDRNYNRPVRLPYGASAEQMCRADGLYDVVIVVGYNDRPRVRGKGSAIFIHVAREGCAPTEGCVALKRAELIRLAARINPTTRLVTDI